MHYSSKNTKEEEKIKYASEMPIFKIDFCLAVNNGQAAYVSTTLEMALIQSYRMAWPGRFTLYIGKIKRVYTSLYAGGAESNNKPSVS